MGELPPVLRAFIAVELESDILTEMSKVRSDFEKLVPPGSVRWVRPEGIHLTLKFLGDTRRERVPAVQDGIRRAVVGIGHFEIGLASSGCFPNCRRPRVIWIGIDEEDETLLQLQKRIEKEMQSLGWAPERRPFSPHLTLGRVQRNATTSEVRRIGEVVAESHIGTLGVQQVTEVALIRSILRPGGARYVKLFSAKLE